MYYFYCPNCGTENTTNVLPKGIIPNIRDGFGTPIFHYECYNCHNLDAGYMQFGIGKMSEVPEEDQKQYFQSIIGMYQNIRGIKS